MSLWKSVWETIKFLIFLQKHAKTLHSFFWGLAKEDLKDQFQRLSSKRCNLMWHWNIFLFEKMKRINNSNNRFPSFSVLRKKREIFFYFCSWQTPTLTGFNLNHFNFQRGGEPSEWVKCQLGKGTVSYILSSLISFEPSFFLSFDFFWVNLKTWVIKLKLW